jgi:hypothetical protein
VGEKEWAVIVVAVEGEDDDGKIHWAGGQQE